MLDLLTVAIISAAFVLGGIAKGVIGLGLPTLSLGLLTVMLDLTTAMALVLFPSVFTNIWQAFVGGDARQLLRRVWPFLLTATVTVWLGATALTRLDSWLLSTLLGGVLIAYATLNLGGIRIAIIRRHETWAGPLFGTVNGILTGMTGSSVVPGVIFLQGIGLQRDAFVQAMGMLFLASTSALALALFNHNLLTLELGMISVAAIIPAGFGMVAGQLIRRRLSEERFRLVFFIGIMVLGLYIVVKSARAV